MCKFSSKSGGVPFQISFFLGDLTRNDPYETKQHIQTHVKIQPENECIDFCSFCL